MNRSMTFVVIRSLVLALGFILVYIMIKRSQLSQQQKYNKYTFYTDKGVCYKTIEKDYQFHIHKIDDLPNKIVDHYVPDIVVLEP